MCVCVCTTESVTTHEAAAGRQKNLINVPRAKHSRENYKLQVKLERKVKKALDNRKSVKADEAATWLG